MLHEEFAERVAGQLEARAEELEREEGQIGRDATRVRARVLRVAADVAPREATTVTWEEAPPPEAQD